MAFGKFKLREKIKVKYSIMHSSLISVIIPVYNRATWLEEAVQSVFLTKYTNLEVLIVDDGSTDGSLNIAQMLAKRYEGKVKCIQHSDKKNHGIGPSKNLGVKTAKGEYICFLDSDDRFLTHRFKASTKILDSDATIDGVYDWSRSEFLPDGEFRIGTVRPIISFDSKSPEDVLNRILSEGKHWAGHAITLRKNIFEKVGGFSEKLPRCEDLVLWLKLACVAKLVKGTEVPVGVYRIHATNTSSIDISGITMLPMLAYLEAYIWSKKFSVEIKKQNMLKTAVIGKLFYVCSRYRQTAQPTQAIYSLFLMFKHIPSLVLKRLFWGNLYYSIRECVFFRRKIKNSSKI